MLRTVSASLSLVAAAPATVALQIGVADGLYERTEHLSVVVDGEPVEPKELGAPHGGRMHHLLLPTGDVEIRYEATVVGADTTQEIHEHDLMTYLRPSRYVESDRLYGFARSTFAGLRGYALVEAVRTHVAAHVAYRPGSSRGTDSAHDTLARGRGVCRDFAHLVAAFLRAMDTPARVTAVYSPGLAPMDFHAVAEAFVEGRWHVVDATGLAPREAMLRITTGRDTSDTAFLSCYGGSVRLTGLRVDAQLEGDLPVEDPARPVVLS